MSAGQLGMQMKTCGRTAAVAGLVLFALSGCGGGGGGGGSAVPAVGAGPLSSTSAQTTIKFTVPNGNTASGSTRNSQSVPSSIAGIVVFAYAASGTQPSTPTLVGDLAVPPTVAGNTSLCVSVTTPSPGRLCTITFTAPVGTDVVSVQLYDKEPSGGSIPSGANLVASGTSSLTVSLNGANSATITLNSVTATINASITTSLPPLTPSSGGSITGGSVNFSIPAGLAPNGAQVGVAEVLQLSLPALSSVRRVQSTAGGTFVYAFGFTLSGASALSSPGLTISASFNISGPLSSSLSKSGTMNIARLSGTTYVDTGTVGYTFSSGTLTLSGGSSGVTLPGVYIIYIPAAAPIGSSSTSATGALAVLTISGTTFAYVPTPTGLMQVALTNGSALASGGSTTAPVGNAVDACAADAGHNIVYCAAFSGTSIYPFDVSSGSVSPLTPITTDASASPAGFSGGSCLICGIVYDSVGNDVIISTNGFYEVYSPAGTRVTKIAARIAENFGFDTSSRTIFSPTYDQGATSIDLINIANPGWFTLSAPPSGLSSPDHGAIDTSTKVAITANEFSSGNSESMFLVNLNGVSFPTPSSSSSPTLIPSLIAQPQTLTSGVFSTCDTTADGIAVDSSAHLAFFASEFCSGRAGFGVAQLPTASTASPAFGDYVFAVMPNVAPVGSFADNQDPHALTVFNLPGVCADCAVISNFSKSVIAIIDLNQLMAATRSGTDAHTVDSSVNLTASSKSGNPVVTYLTTGLFTALSQQRSPASAQQNHNIH
jgi:hypothetical protein